MPTKENVYIYSVSVCVLFLLNNGRLILLRGIRNKIKLKETMRVHFSNNPGVSNRQNVLKTEL